MLQACATTDGDGGANAPAGEQQPPAYVPQAGLSDKQRFREVLTLLEAGEPTQARAELLLYLDAQPGSEIGSDLLAQIDTPADEYFPEDYRELKLQSGWSLSTLAQRYLGSVYRFHALAKYNGIAEPRRLTAGQTIRIPLTASARAAFAAEDAGVPVPEPEQSRAVGDGRMAPADTTPAPAAGPVADAPLPAPAAAPEPEPAVVSLPEPASAPEAQVEAGSQQVEQLHREALNAYRAQDLDRAIDLWDEVLELDPDHESARLYRSQAVELKRKLSNLL